jgi:hypothetical protein
MGSLTSPLSSDKRGWIMSEYKGKLYTKADMDKAVEAKGERIIKQVRGLRIPLCCHETYGYPKPDKYCIKFNDDCEACWRDWLSK